MKVLRIKAFQETVCYKKPFANKVTETYPLPPYSTVKGMIHAVLNADRLIPFSLSIQGDYETQMVDYRKTYLVKKHEFAMPIVLEGISEETPEYSTNVMTSMPLYTHMLYNVQLVFHIKAEEEVLHDIYHGFQELTSFVSLGRHEDLLRIDELDFVSLTETDDCFTKHAVYVPKAQVTEEGLGVPYLLNWTYTIKKGIREWNKIPSIYIPRNEQINEDYFNSQILIDHEGYPVFWNQ
ncbi:type I-B CRISPR-associated protein Cas5 [Lentibacillus cibarius]|uniref:Type I-B CRISPR-associated protein Cas5 n=1 Tax=Lentibacillus cibarius TaxID=2583219 RepID=A0A549YEH7_9BACI|nr:type I-B CRISPR-associated protein Cas5b [Lentibacillus cibarius]TMN21379.1 type I-B CRISPR-associated protein Cas5 [Lentibacillus cibarius]TRM10258.1 type I-B CRISPR-associated protein Cas5 [Lentibacillus cibarius]